jgi:GntR family transcriptional regulator
MLTQRVNVMRADMSHQPLYLQIKEALKKQILSGEYAPNQRMPSESELMGTFDVSRITVRQALRDLNAEGLVFTSQGKGTFASKPKAKQNVQHLQGFEEAMRSKGYDATARILSVREMTPNKDVQEKLDITGKDGVIEIVRVRYLNGEPVSLDTSYFPVIIGKQLLSKDLTGDIFPLLENDLLLALGKAEISLEARPAEAEIAKELGIEEGAPIMWVKRLVKDIHGHGIDYEYLAIRGDSYQYHFEIDRQAQRLSNPHSPTKEDEV